MVAGGDGWPLEPCSQSNKYYQHELRLVGVCNLWISILQVIDKLKFKQRKDGLLEPAHRQSTKTARAYAHCNLGDVYW